MISDGPRHSKDTLGWIARGRAWASPRRLRNSHAESCKYEQIEGDEDRDVEKHDPPSRDPRGRAWVKRGIILVSVLSVVMIAIYLGVYDRSSAEFPTCVGPRLRREWRTLDDHQKAAFVSAVQCLMHYPSIYRASASAYDDFVYAHAQAGGAAHYAASFLPWHRFFVHVYEQALRSKCMYDGPLPYWDWTLDHQDLAASPIWSNTPGLGFGGNGVASEESCVQDGAFAGSIRAWNGTSESSSSHSVVFWPHCMKRSFISAQAESDSLAESLQHQVAPINVQETLDQSDYDAFFRSFELGPHNAIPQFIRGEWLSLTASNDPVFFLHHAQVDRLWWMWQQKDPAVRLTEFHGPAQDFLSGHDSHDSPHASSTDILPMAGLEPDRRVRDLMDTTGGFLCYEY